MPKSLTIYITNQSFWQCLGTFKLKLNRGSITFSDVWANFFAIDFIQDVFRRSHFQPCFHMLLIRISVVLMKRDFPVLVLARCIIQRQLIHTIFRWHIFITLIFVIYGGVKLFLSIYIDSSTNEACSGYVFSRYNSISSG